MTMYRRPASTAILCAIVAAPLPAFAQTADPAAPVQRVAMFEETGASHRIDYSGKLRMLSQRIPSAACNEASGVAVDAAADQLAAAVAEYDRIIAALEFGDEGLGIIGPERDRKVLFDIQALHEIWDPLHVEVDAMIAGDLAMEHAIHIAEASPELLEIAKHMVAMIRAEHADPAALMAADALVIDMAGRQRMLAQRISKNACLLASGIGAEAAVAEMDGAAKLFDVTLHALRDGMPEAGIAPPPNDDIRTKLGVVIGHWDDAQPILARMRAGEEVSVDDREIIFHCMNKLTGLMNEIVGDYATASQQGL